MLSSFSAVPNNCEYVDQPGTYLPFTDTYFPNVNDIEECRSHCSSQGTYNCRSFNYNAFRKECFLSADDSASLPAQLQTDRDFTFSERAGCNSGQSYFGSGGGGAGNGEQGGGKRVWEEGSENRTRNFR